MTFENTLLSNNDVVSFLLENSLQDDYSFLVDRSAQLNLKNRRHTPVSLVNAIDIIRSNPNEADYVVWTIISQKRRGSGESFLELIDLLQSVGKSTPAFILTTYAISVVENSGDLYAAEIELLLQWADATSVSDIIQKMIDQKYKICWTPRFCRAVCGVFWALAKDGPQEKKAEIAAAGLQCAMDLQTKDPTSEWGYYWEVQILWLISPEEAAKKLRRYVVFAQPEPFIQHIDDRNGELSCPRCCQMYIQHILSKNILSFQQIEQVAIKGYRDTLLMAHQDLSRKERAEAAALLEYFSSEIERIASFRAITSDLPKKPLREIPIAGVPRENILTTQEKYKTKFNEED